MNAKKCDRCGKFYVPQIKTTDVITRIEQVVLKEKHITDICDLCPDCVKAFYDWLRSAEVKGGEQG
jgi:hypothetical protein